MLSSGIGFQKGCDSPDALIADEGLVAFRMKEDVAILFPGTTEATGGSSELHLVFPFGE